MPQRHLRWRDRCFPWLTLAVAAFWTYAMWQQAPRILHEILEASSARLVAIAWVGGMGSGSPVATKGDSSAQSPMAPGMLPSFSLLISGTRPAASAGADKKTTSPFAGLPRAVRTVETVVYVWQRMMYAVAALLGVAALVSWLTGRTRPAHLAVAAVVLLGSAATLAGMRIIESPAAGAMPPLPRDSYVLVGAVLSGYAWVLLVAFARPAPRGGTHTPVHQPKLDDGL